jgi:phosphoketolase
VVRCSTLTPAVASTATPAASAIRLGTGITFASPRSSILACPRFVTKMLEPVLASDENLSRDGRVLEVLSEHMCQGWLEGYLLTGRHGFFSCYEGFIHIVDSMFNQHAKWLEATHKIPWRRPISSLNYLLTSHVWRQDHNGFSHQDPGFIDFVMNKKAGLVRVYLPADANCLLSVADHCLRSRNYVNVIVAGKQPNSSGSIWRQPSSTAPMGLGYGPGPAQIRTVKRMR